LTKGLSIYESNVQADRIITHVQFISDVAILFNFA